MNNELYYNGEFFLRYFNYSYSQLSHSDHFSYATTSAVSDHFVNNRFVSQLNSVSRALSKATTTQISLGTATTF